jgi:hypothetical protein
MINDFRKIKKVRLPDEKVKGLFTFMATSNNSHSVTPAKLVRDLIGERKSSNLE